MNTPLEELVSRNLNYKALILRTEEKEPRFESIVYRWNEAKVDSEGKPLWEKIAGPFVVDSFETAKHLAQQHLDLMSGEVVQDSISEGLMQEIQEALGHDDFSFLDISNFNVSFLKDPEAETFDKTEVQQILSVGEFYYLETSESTWLTGFLYDEGVIRCWKSFKTLKSALLEISKK